MSKWVMVFGSNRQGRHGKGAAAHALRHRAAVYGQAEGRQGSSYAIVTKELRPDFPPVSLEEVAAGVGRLLDYARGHPHLVFQITPVGCGLAGFTPEQIAPLFADAPSNCELPTEFISVLGGRSHEST